VLIDWFTVAAQVVNFMVLMVLLKIFLYDRIIQAMDAREKDIQQRQQAAEERRAKADEAARSFHERKASLEERREELLSEARSEAETQRGELLKDARREVDRRRRRWLENLDRDKEAFVDRFRELATEQIIAVVRAVIRDLADSQLETQALKMFKHNIRQLSEAGRRELKQSALEAGRRVRLISSFKVAADARRGLTRVLHDTIDKDLDIEYLRDPDLLLGVELKTADKKVAWNLNHYLNDLKTEIQAGIKAQKKGSAKKTDQESDETADEPNGRQTETTSAAREKGSDDGT